jgi:hypothetical protein
VDDCDIFQELSPEKEEKTWNWRKRAQIDQRCFNIVRLPVLMLHV